MAVERSEQRWLRLWTFFLSGLSGWNFANSSLNCNLFFSIRLINCESGV